jgi:AcrR family transcriptional regulator
MCARPADRNAKIDLLQAAEAVFVERGLDGARVEEITARAGRSKGAFYLHFESKEDAFRQLVETTLARLSACVEENRSVDSVPPTGEALLAEWFAKDLEVLEFVWQNRRLMRLLFEGGGSAAYSYLIDEFYERNRINIEKSFRLGVEAGYFRGDLDIAFATAAISGLYDRVCRELCKSDERPDFRHLARQLQLFVLAGLASDSLRPAVLDVLDPPAKQTAKEPTR